MMSRIAIFGVAALAVLGCRTDPNVPVLERELRLQEDKIYQLEAQLADSRASLEACRCQTRPARSEAPALPGGAAAPEVSGPALTPSTPAEPVVPQPPIVELPGQPQSQMPGTLQPPKSAAPAFEPPKSPPPGTPPAAAPPSATTPPAAEPVRPSSATGGRWRKATPTGRAVEHGGPGASVSGGPVDRILLNPSMTGGLNADGKPGDEGLTVFIEPQDSQGRAVLRPAPVSVVVLDRQASGQAARVARWDFTAEQVGQRIRRTSVGSGIHLEMPWPSQPPAHKELQIFVRYEVDASHQLEAAMPVALELPGAPREWTAAQPGTKKIVTAAPPAATPAQTPAPARAPAAEPAARPIASPARMEAANAKPRPSDPPLTEARRPVWSPTR